MLPSKALSLISSFLDVSPNSAPQPPLKNSSVQTQRPKVKAIVFSKDRPGQLLSCLASASAFISGVQESCVIYASSNERCSERYRETFSRLRASSIFNRLQVIKQDTSKDNFLEIVRDILADDNRSKDAFVWFQVDDAIHYGHWDACIGADVLTKHEAVLCLHSKLWKGAVRCHPAGDERMLLPSFCSLQQTANVVTFRRAEGTHDWNYAFDLSGGLYRSSDVQDLMNKLPSNRVTNPNSFEALGNEFLAELQVMRPLSACMNCDSPWMSLVTINRIQTQYPNPVYDSKFASTAPWEELTDELFNSRLDYEAYRRAALTFDAVHVGELLLVAQSTQPNAVDASVLIPCRNAERTLHRAIESILMQNYGGYRVEVVVVDDASTDGSYFVAKSFGQERVRVLTRPRSHQGVAGCLDFGISKCQGDLIIRMDADDESLPGRIVAQIGRMRASPQLAVLGMQTLICRGEVRTPAPAPVGAASVAWSLYFFCSLVHPSVCFRKEAVLRLGGFARSNCEMEDVAAWHELAASGEWELDNLEQVGLIHYKHALSVTSQWTHDKAHMGFSQIAVNKIKNRCAMASRELTVEMWMAVCRPDRYSLSDKSSVECILEVLEALKHSITASYMATSSEEDLEFVRRDCEARKLEIKSREIIRREI